MKGHGFVESAKSAFLGPLAGEKRRVHRAGAVAGAVAVCLVAMLFLSACGSGKSEQTPASPSAAPSIEAASLLDTRCSVCHSADKAKAAKNTRDGWEQTVTRMIGKGAQLNDAEKAALVDYLANTYGP